METLSIRVEKSGRILIPVGVRRKLGIKEGETDIMLKLDETNTLGISTRAQALDRAIVRKAGWANRQVSSGTQLEIVQFVGGG